MKTYTAAEVRKYLDMYEKEVVDRLLSDGFPRETLVTRTAIRGFRDFFTKVDDIMSKGTPTKNS